MTYEEKLIKILDAIQAARKNFINDLTIKLYTATANGLEDFDPNEIYDILHGIERQEKVLEIEDVPSIVAPHAGYPPPSFSGEYSPCFKIRLLEGFDNWYSQILSAQKTTEITNFDNATGILTINGNSVSLQKGSFRTEMLTLIMKNRKKVWQWDEIIEKILGIHSSDEVKKYKYKFYPACDGLQKRIAQKIGINDFLIFNNSTVQFNPKYL